MKICKKICSNINIIFDFLYNNINNLDICIFLSIILIIYLIIYLKNCNYFRKRIDGGNKYESCNEKSLSIKQGSDEIYYIYSGKIYKENLSNFYANFGLPNPGIIAIIDTLIQKINTNRDILYIYNFDSNSTERQLIKTLIDQLDQKQSENLCINNFKL